MESNFVTINKVPTKVITLGSKIEENPPKLIIVIPGKCYNFHKRKDIVFCSSFSLLGNPGSTGFYIDFMHYLKNEKPSYSIWTIAHAGHENPKGSSLPDLNENPDLFSLQANIQHKVDFIKTYIDPKKTEVILVGHSIGCKMVIEIMKSEVVDFKMGCLLFPMIERMKFTPAGKRTWKLVYYIPKLVIGLAWILSLIPQSILTTFIRFWMELTKTSSLSDSNLNAVLKLIDPEVIKHSFYLADTEFQTVLDPDYESIAKLQDKLKFYYGTIDAWVPTEYYEELVQNVPNVHAELCTSKHPHAFVLSASKPMAEIVAGWINSLE